jgi:hypothetical protein
MSSGATGLQARAERAAHVDAVAVRMRFEPACLHLVEAEHQVLDRLAGGRDLDGRHLRKILLLQHLSVGDGQARIELDVLLLALKLLSALEQRVEHALRGLRLVRRRQRAGRLRRHHRDQPVEIAALAEEQLERLVEQHGVLMPLHEHRMQGPVEIIPGADAGGAHRGKRVKHRAGADRNAGSAQRPGEVDDVLGELAGRISRHRECR